MISNYSDLKFHSKSEAAFCFQSGESLKIGKQTLKVCIWYSTVIYVSYFSLTSIATILKS